MQADMDDEVYMKIEGSMADLLIKLDPEHYNKFVEIRNGKKSCTYYSRKHCMVH
jgi:hypothetical protein